MRLFLGIELSVGAREEIAKMLAPLRISGKGWEHPHDYHLTLLFIGEVPEKIRMPELSTKPFLLTTTTFQFFNRRIMYLGCELSPELLSLRKEIHLQYPEYLKKDEKEFVPHITVKRWQRYEHAELVKGLEVNPMWPLKIPVNEVALFQSEKDSENRKYHVIDRVPLRR